MPTSGKIGSAKFALNFILILFALLVSLLTFDLCAQSITWFRSYVRSGIDKSSAIVQTLDNGYIFAGTNFSIGLTATRLNLYGDTIWNRIFPGVNASGIIRTSDDNYIVVGSNSQLTKFDIFGNIIWSKGPYEQNIEGVCTREFPDNKFILYGLKTFGNRYLPILLKLSWTGDLIWMRTYTDHFGDGYFTGIDITNDNNYILTGTYSEIPYSQTDALFIMKADTSGAPLFFYGYDTLQYFYSNFVDQCSDGSFIVGGNWPALIKIHSNGSIQWLREYLILENAGGLNTINTFDGGYAITGYYDTSSAPYESCALLMRIDSEGTEQSTKVYLYAQNDINEGMDVKQTSDSGFIITGNRFAQNEEDVFVLKTDKFGNTTVIGINPISRVLPLRHHLYQNYPNPFNPVTKIKFDIKYESLVSMKVYDLTGRLLQILVNANLNGGIYETELDMSDYSSGLYFYKLEVSQAGSSTGSFVDTKKMVLLK